MKSTLKILKDAGANVTSKDLHRRTPQELSLAEKWAVEIIQPGTFPGATMPTWLRPYTKK